MGDLNSFDMQILRKRGNAAKALSRAGKIIMMLTTFQVLHL